MSFSIKAKMLVQLFFYAISYVKVDAIITIRAAQAVRFEVVFLSMNPVVKKYKENNII